jgi:hypothetical protein
MRKPTALSVTDTTPNFHVRRCFFHSISLQVNALELLRKCYTFSIGSSWVKAVASLKPMIRTQTSKRVTATITVTWNLYFRNLHEKLCKIWDPWCVWTWNLAVPSVCPDFSPVWTERPHGVKTSFSWLLPFRCPWKHHFKLSLKYSVLKTDPEPHFPDPHSFNSLWESLLP